MVNGCFATDKARTDMAVCIANISSRERQRRLIAGIVPFAGALAVLAGLSRGGAQRWWRLAVFPLFWGATIGFFQWRDRT